MTGALAVLGESLSDREPAPSVAQEMVFSEGSHLAFDLSPDGRTIVFDLVGQLWLVPVTGGEAQPLTDALRDSTDDRDPEFSPDGRRVLFWSDRADTNGFYAYELNTGTIRGVPLAEDADYPHAWSPDGREVLSSPLLRGQGPPANALQVNEVSTGASRRIRLEGLQFPSARNAAWTPDGMTIVFINPELPFGPLGQLWEVAREGGAAKPLLPPGSQAMAPAPSPDNTRIAYYAVDTADVLQLWVLHRATGSVSRLTRHSGKVDPADHRFRVRWTPDGMHLIYVWDGRLYSLAADGGTPREIPFRARIQFAASSRRPGAYALPRSGSTIAARSFDALAISPDGEQIAVIALDSLRVVTVDGRARSLAKVERGASGVTWSPDGRRLVWSAGPAGREALFLTTVDGGTARRLTSLPGGARRAAWSPDGQSIAFVYADTGASPSTRLLLMAADAPSPVAVPTVDLGAVTGMAGWPFNVVPQWVPDGSALMIQQGSAAVLVPLQGERRRVALPSSAAFLRLAPDSALLFTHGNQVWRQPLFADSSRSAAPMLVVREAASHLSVSRSGAIAYVSGDGLVVRRTDAQVTRLAWPVRFSVPAPPPLLIRNAHVVASAGVSAMAHDILLTDGVIARIAPAGTIRAMPGVAIIDGSGRFVMPGLINGHSHLDFGETQLPAQLYHGITTIRNPHGQPLNWSAARRDDLDAGLLLGPRLLTGALLNPGCFFETCAQNDIDQYPRDVGETTRSIELMRTFGASHVKMYRPFTMKAGARMIAQAHAQDLRVIGHIAHTLPLLAAGIDGKEHGAQQLDRTTPTLQLDLMALSLASGITVTPTIAVAGQIGRVLDDSTLRLEPATLFLSRTSTAARAISQMIQPANRGWSESWVREWSSRAARLHRMGVRIAVGTDAPLPWLVHLELELLVGAGLSPIEAIRAGTIQTAQALGIDRQVGAVREGYLADLLILDADPTSDIRNTRRIQQVISRGFVVNRQTLLR